MSASAHLGHTTTCGEWSGWVVSRLLAKSYLESVPRSGVDPESDIQGALSKVV